MRQRAIQNSRKYTMTNAEICERYCMVMYVYRRINEKIFKMAI